MLCAYVQVHQNNHMFYVTADVKTPLAWTRVTDQDQQQRDCEQLLNLVTQ